MVKLRRYIAVVATFSSSDICASNFNDNRAFLFNQSRQPEKVVWTCCPVFPADEQHTEVKVEQAPATVKKEAPIVAETKVLDGATQSVTSGKKKNSAKKQKTDHGNDDKILRY